MVLGALLASAAPVCAQDVPSGDAPPPRASEVPPAPGERPASAAAASEVYTPADFARFAPRSALDLVEQIPGFNVQGGGGNGGGGRGFGQASENLLINGARLSSKSTSTRDQLSRISVDNVIRIEVVDGATLDIPGLSGRVANIIVAAGGLSGQFEWRPQYSTGPSRTGWSEGEISVTGTSGALGYTLALVNNGFVRGSGGPAIFTDGAGAVDARENVQSAEFDRPELSANVRWQVAPDVVANINVLGGLTIFRSREDETRLAGNPRPAFLEQFRTTNDEWFYELGGDIEFPLGPGRFKLILLESYEDGDFVTQALVDEGAAPRSGTRFARLSQEGERIARGEYSWGMLGADWQLSGEAAFNRLDNVASLFVFDAAAEAFAPIDFPAGTGGVREDRYEGLLSVGFPLTDTISVQLIGGGEYSTISQTGINARSRSFRRPKGSLNIAWAAGENLDVNLEIARRVGQLDFGDFLASVNLTDDNQSAGNNELRPQQNWDVNLELTRNFGAFGSATLTLFDERIEDLVLIVPVAGGGEARGNIADARRYGLRLTGTLELEPLGLRGAKIDGTLTAEKSKLSDPVTGLRRRFDGNHPFEIRLDFRHDIPATDYAWGLEFRDTENAPFYRVAETFFDHGPNTFGAVFVEHKDVLGATVKLRVGNLFDGTTTLVRTVYAGPRDSAPVLFTEDRRRKIGQVVNLTVSGSF